MTSVRPAGAPQQAATPAPRPPPVPIAPRFDAWQRRRQFPKDLAPVADEDEHPSRAPLNWKLWAVVAGGVIGVLLLGVVAGLLVARPAARPSVATFRAESGLPVWTVEISKDWKHMTVHAAGLRPRPLTYHYQLWSYPEHGKPVSLVPLPVQGVAHYDLDAPMQKALEDSHRVVVIVESRGPKWTGPPKVILTAELESADATPATPTAAP